MSEDAAGGGGDATQPAHAGHGQSAGLLLRQAREAAGLHVAALAVAIKVPVKKLEALESDRLDLLPDAVFARALASSVCRTLDIDAAPVLERLPTTSAPSLRLTHPGMNTPFHSPGERQHSAIFSRLGRPGALFVFILMMAALIMFMYPAVRPYVDNLFGMPDQKISGLGNDMPSTHTSSSPVMAVEASPVVAQLTASESLSGPVVPPLATIESMPSPKSIDPSISTSSLPAKVDSVDLILLKAKGASWVEVTDAGGAVRLRRTMAAGEAINASGVLPLSVVVGRVDNTEVQVRGKDFDLSAIAKNNVARFEVK